MYWSCVVVVVVVDQVQKRPEKFSEELLSDGTQENDSGFWESLTRYLANHPAPPFTSLSTVSYLFDLCWIWWCLFSLSLFFLSPEGLQEVWRWRRVNRRRMMSSTSSLWPLDTSTNVSSGTCACVVFPNVFVVVIPQFVLSLRIMMLSVLKNTKTPVKFWFLKNYLSPAFKVVIKYKM